MKKSSDYWLKKIVKSHHRCAKHPSSPQQRKKKWREKKEMEKKKSQNYNTTLPSHSAQDHPHSLQHSLVHLGHVHSPRSPNN